MAVDTNSLAYLIDPFWQGEGINGKPLVAGYMCVYIAGTDQKYITWQNWDGTRHPFKIPLGSDGRATILVEVQYTYDCYLYDSFGNLVCSRLNVKPAIGGDVTVYGLTEVWHDSTMSGEGTPQSPLSVVSAGKVYDGVEPIVVNNIENKISANHVPLGVQDPLYFVQDDEEGCIIGCSAQTEIPAELSGKWDEASDVVIANSAQWAEGTEYEAGSYIDIDNNTISVTGLQPTGDYAYNSALSSKLDVTATGQFLTALPEDLMYSGDMTAYQSAGDYLSATDSGNFYPMTGNPSGFLTAHQSLQGYATEQWVENKGYITGVDIQESANWNSTYNTVHDNSGSWTGGGVTGDYELSAGSGISIVDYPLEQKTVISVTAQGGNPEVEQAVIDNSATWDSVTGKQDAGNYVSGDNESGFTIFSTAGEIDVGPNEYLESQAIGIIKSNSGIWLSPNQLEIYGNGLDEIVNASDISALKTLSASKLDASAVNTGHQLPIGTVVTAISGIWLSAKYAQNAVQSQIAYADEDNNYITSTYAKVSAMTAYQEAGDYYSASNPSGFITGVDLTPYQLTADMTAYQPVGSYLTADALDSVSGDWNEVSAKLDTTAFSDVSGTFLTAHQDISNKLDTTAFSDVSGSFLTAVPDTYLQNTDLSTEDGKVTAISGIPLSAGGDVPEGVMVESGLEYNAVNEISGYNGSAIAQYGAEKQFLTHDDTLVHVSNSAQYALGVALPNISADLARMMGVDETVIFDGARYITATGQLNTTESPYNFNKVEIWARSYPDYTDTLATTFKYDSIHSKVPFMSLGINDTMAAVRFNISRIEKNASGFNIINQKQFSITGNATSTADSPTCITKIVGIGRKN